MNNCFMCKNNLEPPRGKIILLLRRKNVDKLVLRRKMYIIMYVEYKHTALQINWGTGDDFSCFSAMMWSLCRSASI